MSSRTNCGRGSEPAFEQVPFEHPLWTLFSSGTTGLPKAIVHSHGGQLIEHLKGVGLGWGELAHGEVVQDEHGGSCEFAQTSGPGAVGVAAGQVGQDAAGLGEPCLGSCADGEVGEGLGDVALADADGAVEDD